MPSDLWNPSEWASPSPEDAVKARVRKRARTLKVRRKVSPAVAVLLLVVVGIQQLPTAQSSSSVRVGDDGGATEEATADEAPPGFDEANQRLRDGVEVRGPAGIGVTAHSGGLQWPTTTTTTPTASSPAPSVSTRKRGEPLVTDPAGDASDQEGLECGKAGCGPIEEETTQPVLDLLSGDVRCTGTAAVLSMQLLDLDTPPRGSPESLGYTSHLVWDDEGPPNVGSTSTAWRGAVFEATVTKSTRTGAIAVAATVSVYEAQTGSTYRRQPVEGVTVVRQGDSYVVTAPFDAIRKATEATYPGRRPLEPGALFGRLSAATSKPPNVTNDSMGPADYEARYRLCD